MKKFFIFTCCLLLLTGCSTKKNTPLSRFWQGFTAHYNTYFNGIQAYEEGIDAQAKGNVDNFTQHIPVFPINNKNTYALGTSQFDRAIEKSKKDIQLFSIKAKPEINPRKPLSAKQKQFMKRKEYNPFLRNAWFLMGKAQFHKGLFIEAASTFSYMTRLYAAETPVAQEARAWLARCYTAQNWLYDAEQVLDELHRLPLTHGVEKQLNPTKAALLLGQERYKEALPYLRLAAKQASTRLQKARLYFLLGQIEQTLNMNAEAYADLKRCVSLAPPYRMALSAQMLQTEVISQNTNIPRLITRLKRMIRSDKNKNYLATIYYALGNVQLVDRDTAAAIKTYEEGRAKSTESSPDKAALLLRLADLYWQQGHYDKSQNAYNDALGMIDQQYKGYDRIAHRTKVLDELVPYTTVVFTQDSLQALADMPLTERNKVIDAAIEAYKKHLRDLKRARADSLAAVRRDESESMAGGMPGLPSPQQRPTGGNNNKLWYFYNPMLVQQGKQDFKKRWGNRKNEDNWRRSNKTVVALDNGGEVDYNRLDSLEAAQDSLAQLEAADSSQVVRPDDDPLQRAYYLKDLPFTSEQKKASDLLIADALYHAGIIEKDDLEDFPLAAKTLVRLVRQYPWYENNEDAYYQLFLLYSRWGRPADADRYKQLLAAQYPASPKTKRILDPDFLRLGREGKQMEDSLYTATYDAYLRHDRATVTRNFERSTRQFADGINRPKFIFIHALSQIGHADVSTIEKALNTLIAQYPNSDVSEPAGMILNGLKAGRQIGTGNYDLGSLWNRRLAVNDSVSENKKVNEQLQPKRNTPFVFLVVYPQHTLSDNELLYGLAHFNFSGFYLRSFDMEKVIVPMTPGLQADSAVVGKKAATATQKLVEFRIYGFQSYDEAHRYAQEAYADTTLAGFLRKAKVFLISQHNLGLVPSVYSFDDYKKFFAQHYAPLKIDASLPLDYNPHLPEQQDDTTPLVIYPKATKGRENDSVVVMRPTLQPKEKTPVVRDDEYALPATDNTSSGKTDETSVPLEVPTAPRKEEQPNKEKETPKKVNPLLPSQRQPQPKEQRKEEDDTYPMTEKEKQDTKAPTKPVKPVTPKKEVPKKSVPAKKEPVKQPEKQPVEDESGGWYPV